MAEKVDTMGGEANQIGIAEARSLLSWWLEAGVDAAVDEKPRNWLSVAPTAASCDQKQFPPPASPDDLEAFRAWLADSPDLPGSDGSALRILPVGTEGASLMIVTDVPAAEDAASGRPLAGECWALTERMLAAIGVAPKEAYLAPISCFCSPAMKLADSELAAWGEIARRHVSLVRPQRLLLFGDAPSKALLGRPLAPARGHAHRVEGVRTVATFNPRFLLNRPARKADAWRDLLLLMEDEV